MTEVLSPVGGIDVLEAAVRSGADAVYLGVDSFNARKNATNFNINNLIQAVSYCHIRGVKVYLTLNTLVTDDERETALSVAEKSAQCGVDAIILQDLGLASLVKKALPQMPLHASTQMSIHSAEALPFLKKMGFSRVVPAREMDKDSLKLLCQKAKELEIEVEVFVHGALCMCLSGQCYLSSVLGARSGNRGCCAQPCRLEFMVQNGTGHDLSLKDLSLTEHIKELTEMGVTSFKIEGRMKRAEYVAAATAVCRMAADGKEIDQQLKTTLSNVFSRSGHTDGYFTKNIGKEMFGYRTREDVALSSSALNTTHELYRAERKAVEITASMKLTDLNSPISLTISDGEQEVCVFGLPPEKAKNLAASEEYLKSKLSKLGSTPYYLGNFSAEIGEGLTISSSAFAELKRQALETLNEKRGEPQKPIVVSQTLESQANFKKRNKKTFAQFADVSKIPQNLEGIDTVVVPVECDLEQVLKKVDGKTDVAVDVPRGVMQCGELVLKSLKNAAQKGIKTAFCGNIAAFKMAVDCGLQPIADYGMNIFNSNSVSAVKNHGAVGAVVSFEANVQEINKISDILPRGIIAYGKLPLMIFKNCPNKNGDGCKNCNKTSKITDRMGIEFTLKCRFDFTEMFNSVPVYMIDRLNEVNNIDFVVLRFTDESTSEIEQILNLYKNQAPFGGKFTRALYYKKVL